MARSSSPTRPATSHGGDTVEDLHTWLEQVAANRMKQASKLGARALKQETLSTPSQRRARSQPTLRNSASASSSGEFFLYRGQMLPRGGWENNPLRTEVSALQHEMRSHRSAATLQHSSIERWNPLSAAASAAELRYGYRFGDAGASRRPSPSPGPPPPHASVASLRSAGGGPGSPKSRQSFAEMLSGSLFEELTPPPPPSEIPEEYHLYDMQVERKQVAWHVPRRVAGHVGAVCCPQSVRVAPLRRRDLGHAFRAAVLADADGVAQLGATLTASAH